MVHKFTKARLVCKIDTSHVKKLVWVPINLYYGDVFTVGVRSLHKVSPWGGNITPKISLRSRPGVAIKLLLVQLKIQWHQRRQDGFFRLEWEPKWRFGASKNSNCRSVAIFEVSVMERVERCSDVVKSSKSGSIARVAADFRCFCLMECITGGFRGAVSGAKTASWELIKIEKIGIYIYIYIWAKKRFF